MWSTSANVLCEVVLVSIEARQEWVIVEVVRKTLLPDDVGVFVEQIYKCFLLALS